MRCFNRSIFTSIFLSLLFSTSAMALAPNPSCDAETACPDGWSCQLMACDAIACDPDDENCDSNCLNEGMCVANPKPQCGTDADCGPGLVCEKESAPQLDCLAGEECPPAATFAKCVPASCKADSDCGAGLVCLTVDLPCKSKTATAIDLCPPDTNCAPTETDPDEAEPCVPENKQFCAPKWAAPCDVDKDCGDGFSCKEAMMCQCSGSGSVPPNPTDVPTDPTDVPQELPEETGDDDNDSAQEPDCDCQPTGKKYCKAKQIDCEVSEDCPTDWTCKVVGGMSTTCAQSSDGSEAEDCEEGIIEEWKQCTPANANSWQNALDGTGSGGESALANLNTGDGNTDPKLPADGSDVEVKSSGGCQAAGNGSRTGMATLLILLALVAIRLRLYNHKLCK
ncbi:MAG TPA: hypothetical protein EYN66_20070 [Myxococcales bacterium]|nr:hypothetical protein [Myxococcales bacterium]